MRTSRAGADSARPARSMSSRAARIIQSEIRAMTIECERLGGINLAQGVCDLELPGALRRGAHEAIDLGLNSYTRFDGLSELRGAIARKAHLFNGLEVDPETQVTVSAGATGALYCACLALLEPGDEVVLFEPYYGYHVNTLLAVDAIPTYVKLRPPGWTFSSEDLEATLTPRTRAIMVNTPANPSGKVFTGAELEVVADVARRWDLFVLTDEIYEYFVYDGRRHLSIAALPGMGERTVTVSGFSKVFSVTGWRIGYSISDPVWAETIGYVNDLVYVCAPAPLQHAVAVGVDELDPGFYGQLAADYQSKRDRLCVALERAGLHPLVAEGAYYVLADVSRVPGRSARDRAMHILRTTGVAGVPGDAFFEGGEGHDLARFCFAKEDDELEDACRRFGRATWTRGDGGRGVTLDG